MFAHPQERRDSHILTRQSGTCYRSPSPYALSRPSPATTSTHFASGYSRALGERCQSLKMRRTTLGPVSNNGLNASASRRNPRSTLGPLKPTEERRQSAMSSYGRSRRATATAIVPPHARLSSRPSMTYSGRSGMRSDPRPLHDKHYMQQCVKNLISFVIDRGYDQPISPKILTNPSSRDFQYIFLFLMRCLDPSFAFQKRFEDEVPVLLRCLGYPFSVSKSALSAVGSPHTWPSLLGVLTWLMGLIKYDEARKERESADKELDPQARRTQIFYENTVEAYAQFLQGADTHPELDEKLREHFESENTRRREEISMLEADRDQLARTLETLRMQPSPLELLNDQLVSVETNVRKFHVLLPSLIEHHNLVSKKIKVKETEISKEETELGALAEEKQRLLRSLAIQDEAGIDTERLAADKDRLRESLENVSIQRAQMEEQLSHAEETAIEASSALDAILRQYHQATGSLELVMPVSRKHRGTNDLEISVCRESSLDEKEQILSKNIESHIMPVIARMTSAASDEVPQLQDRSLALQESIDEQEEELILRRNQLSMLESRKTSLEVEYQKTRSDMTDQLETRKQQILRREDQIVDSRNRLHEQVEDTDRRLQSVEGFRIRNREKYGRQRHFLLDIAHQDGERVQSHQESITRCIAEVEQHFEDSGWRKAV